MSNNSASGSSFDHNNNNELFEKKSVEHRHRMKVWKEAEHQRAEEVARWKVEEEVKWKVEVEAQRRAEVEAKACAEEVPWAQSLVSGPSKGQKPKAEVAEQVGGLAPCYGCSGAGVLYKMKTAGGSKARRKWEEVMLPRAGKKKVQTQSLVVDDDDNDKYKEEAEDEEAEVAEEREALKGRSKEEVEVDRSV
ncbi:hypothetical protein PAXRUDRAFT_18016 [Paxillus rubicundulus Ve08.2h10]|uniref:Uncharacterized protein n=1 Tax=Paxillus rubicundulus Ve08.2h10 TaxID=930991 RepID=A0A0D0DFU5_9AGAM|nr:hypothetical protein PAXRUDRAFT_18016 [Paxillus rubicundulus Ve08.2h10]